MSQSQPGPSGFSALPSELLDAIFAHLSTQDLVHLRRVNRSLNSEINSNASIIVKHIIARERARINDAITSRPSFENLDLIDALRLYTSCVGLPSPLPIDIDLHSRRLASWYRASNAKNSRGIAALAWQRTAAEVFASYFYLHHALHEPAALKDQISNKKIRFVVPKTMPRLVQLRDEVWTAVQMQDFKRCTILRALSSAPSPTQLPSPWQNPATLDAAFENLQRMPLLGCPVQSAEQEAYAIRQISARVAAARAAGTGMFDTGVSGNPTAALDWALVQKADLPAPGAEFWYAPQLKMRSRFEEAVVRVRHFKRDPLLVAAVWESVEVRPV